MENSRNDNHDCRHHFVVVIISDDDDDNTNNSNDGIINNYNNSFVPTISPTNRKKLFQTTDELMNTLDTYVSLSLNDPFDVIYINIIDQYGILPYWDVSSISNFSSLFSTKRNIIYETFNDNIGLWNVENAITMVSTSISVVLLMK